MSENNLSTPNFNNPESNKTSELESEKRGLGVSPAEGCADRCSGAIFQDTTFSTRIPQSGGGFLNERRVNRQPSPNIQDLPIEAVQALQAYEKVVSKQAKESEFLPFNYDAEMSLLSLIMTEDNIMEKVKHSLTPEMFYVESSQAIFSAFCVLAKANRQINLISVQDQLRHDPKWQKIDEGETILYNLCRILIIEDHEGLVEIIRNKHFRRKIMQLLTKLYKQTQNENIPIENTVKKISETAKLLDKAFYKGESELKSNYLADAYAELIKECSEGGLDKSKISCGYADIDKNTGGGFEKGELIIIGARPSVGKTQVLCDLAYLHWKLHATPVLFISLEMPIKRIARRILGRQLAGVAIAHDLPDKLGSGRLEPKDWDKLGQMYLEAGTIKIAEGKGDIAHIPQLINQTLEENNGQLGLVVIDYVQLMEESTKSENRVRELSNITRSLKRYSLGYQIPIVVAAQIGRQADQRNDKRPMLSDLKESGSLEQDADQVWLLYRDAIHNPNTLDPDIIEINLAKLRNSGSTGIVKLWFDPQYSRLRAIAQRSEGIASYQN